MTTTRDAFEAWFTKARGYATTCKTADGGFEWVAASEAWETWQAATLEAQGKRQPLTDEQNEAIGHRKASTYTHRSDPTSHAYGFVRYTLIDFARQVEAAHGIKA